MTGGDGHQIFDGPLDRAEVVTFSPRHVPYISREVVKSLLEGRALRPAFAGPDLRVSNQ